MQFGKSGNIFFFRCSAPSLESKEILILPLDKDYDIYAVSINKRSLRRVMTNIKDGHIMTFEHYTNCSDTTSQQRSNYTGLSHLCPKKGCIRFSSGPKTCGVIDVWSFPQFAEDLKKAQAMTEGSEKNGALAKLVLWILSIRELMIRFAAMKERELGKRKLPVISSKHA